MKTAKDIMTAQVFTVTPNMALDDLAKAFAERRVSGFPVVDEGGALVGVITESDLIHQDQRLHIPTAIALFDSVIVLGSSKRLEEEIRRVAATVVGEIMTRPPLTVGLDTPVTEVAWMMVEEHAHTLPVLDEQGRMVGVIGKLDLIRATASA